MIDVRTYGALGDGLTNDITAINNCIAANQRTVIHNGTFIINSAILVPSNREVYFKNCTIKLGNACYDNIIRNADLVNGNSNIKIIGLGNVVFDQNAANNNDTANRTTHGKGQTNSWHYLGVFLCNVTNFELSGYTLKNYVAWGHLIQRCANGLIKNVWILKTLSIANQDGLDIGHGSHDIVLENIEGISGDDFIAVVSWNGGDFTHRDYMSGHTYNIDMTDIHPKKAGVNTLRLLAGDGGKITEITATKLSALSSSYNWLMVGQDTYPVTQPTNDDIKNINIDQAVISGITTATHVINLSSACSNLTITNLVNNSGKPLITTNRTPVGVNINGTQYY